MTLAIAQGATNEWFKNGDGLRTGYPGDITNTDLSLFSLLGQIKIIRIEQ